MSHTNKTGAGSTSAPGPGPSWKDELWRLEQAVEVLKEQVHFLRSSRTLPGDSATKDEEEKMFNIEPRLRAFLEHPVTKLDLRAWVHDLDNQGLAFVALTYPHLEKIDLSGGNGFDSQGLLIIARGCPRLERVLVNHCPAVNDEVLDGFLSNCSALRQIEIRGCPSPSSVMTERLVRSWLRKKLTVNWPDESSVLAWAVRGEEEELVKELLAERRFGHNDYHQAACEAAQRDRVDVLAVLLKWKLDLNWEPPKSDRSLSIRPITATDESTDGFTPLHFAALERRGKALRFLLTKSANPDARDHAGRRPLHLAAKSGWAEGVAHLLLKGSRSAATDSTGQSPLHVASTSLVASKLLEYSAPVDLADMDGWTPLFYAVHLNRLEVAALLIERGAHVNRRSEFDGQTPLALAAQEGNLSLCQLLVERGGIVRDTKHNLLSPLHLATLRGHLDVVRYLLEKGASPVAPDRLGRMPLHLAASHGDIHVFVALARLATDALTTPEAASGATTLLLACQGGHEEIVRYLLEMGINGAQHNELDGNTGLHLAAEAGHVSVMNQLLSNKTLSASLINTPNTKGHRPLHLAAKAGKLKAIETLLVNGADATLENVDGWTPLHVAAYEGHLLIVELLLKSLGKEDVDRPNTFGSTALHLAAEMGHTNVISLLLSARADPRIANSSGRTALHSACQEGHLEPVRLLLRHGADVNALNSAKRTPLQLAAAGGYLDVVLALCHEPATNLSILDSHNMTALDVARVAGKEKVVNALRVFMKTDDEVSEKTARPQSGWDESEIPST